MQGQSANPQPYAVVANGGKQYLVTVGATVEVEKINAEPGARVDLQPVLAISDGTRLQVGTPNVANAKATATVVEQFRGPKLISFRKKRRKGYRKARGHRQALTLLKIESIQ